MLLYRNSMSIDMGICMLYIDLISHNSTITNHLTYRLFFPIYLPTKPFCFSSETQLLYPHSESSTSKFLHLHLLLHRHLQVFLLRILHLQAPLPASSTSTLPINLPSSAKSYNSPSTIVLQYIYHCCGEIISGTVDFIPSIRVIP